MESKNSEKESQNGDTLALKPTRLRHLMPCLMLLLALGFVQDVFAQSPTITSFTPLNGPVGTLVTITGTNLGSPTAFNIGGVAALAISNNGSTLVGMVMPGAGTGTIDITTAGGSTSSAGNYTITSTYFPASQQGAKLVGSGNIGNAMQGYSIAISGDGNTVIVGAPMDNSGAGAAWVYVRSGGNWSQEAKLTGTGGAGVPQFGSSVALNADGNTAVIGGYTDNFDQGAVWVFTRSGGVWTQQGSKLVGSSSASPARQGVAVALSGDGNTALIGGYHDNFNQGAVWVFTRSGGTWSQQGSKLVGTGNTGAAGQGSALALSADGNTAIVGGTDDNSNQGAAWVFIRSGGVWSQQGSKLVGTGNIGAAYQGSGMGISADGNTAIVGGYNDNAGIGASWIYTRSGGVWSQQSKLVGTGNTGLSGQGYAVAVSADGNTAFVGGNWNNANRGSNWVFTRSGGVWTQQGNPLTGTGGSGPSQQGYFIGLSADGGTAVAGGYADNSFMGAAWVFIPSVVPTITALSQASGPVGTSVTITGTNFNTTAGNNVVYFGSTQATVNTASSTTLTVTVPAGATFERVSVQNGSLMAYSSAMYLPTYAPSKNSISASDVQAKVDFTATANIHTLATADIDGDGKSDIVAVNYSASNVVSVFRNTAVSGIITSASFAARADFTTGNAPYGLAIGDIDGDGKYDIVVTNSTASTVSVLRNTSTIGAVSFATKVDFNVGVSPFGVAVGDIDRDGKPDIIVANSATNNISVLHNTSTVGSLNMDGMVNYVGATTPYAVSVGDIDGDNKADVVVANRGNNSISVFRNTASSGAISLASRVDFAAGNIPFSTSLGDIDGDGKLDVLVANFNGNNVSAFRNTSSSGTVSFASRNDFTTGTQPAAAVLADYDGDGNADIISANTGSNTFSILRNTSTSGSIGMAAKVDVNAGLYPATIVAGDMDGDGLPDLATANYSSSTLSIYRNNSADYTFYSSAAGAANLQNLASWGVVGNGSGANPVSFSNSSYTFQLANGPGNAYTLNANLTIAGKLIVPAPAVLSTGAFTLTVGDTVTNNGTIAGTLALNGTGSQLLLGSGTISDLVINNSSGVTMGGNTSISNSLMLTSGKLMLGAFNLTLTGTSSFITGMGASKYIVTDGSGSLIIQNIGPAGRSGNVSFPVGNSAYNPVVLNNTGTLDNFSVRVLDDVYNAYSGSTPTGSVHGTDVVDRTWLIDEGTAGGSNSNVTLQWNASEELGTFTRGNCNVAHYTSGAWSPSVSSAASGSDPYSQTRTAVTSFSPFGVHSDLGPLPVEWISFTGKKVFDHVVLNWSTASERNNKQFEVQRATDIHHFETIGFVDGRGTTSLLNNYTFTDMDPFGSYNTLYYRLKQVDFNGDFEFSKMVAVNRGETGAGLHIEQMSPNPFNRNLHLILTNVNEGNVVIEVADMSGKSLYTYTQPVAKGTWQIDLNDLSQVPEGVYMLSVSNGSEHIRQKLVKVR